MMYAACSERKLHVAREYDFQPKCIFKAMINGGDQIYNSYAIFVRLYVEIIHEF